jgi:signal transduction histidine kinase
MTSVPLRALGFSLAALAVAVAAALFFSEALEEAGILLWMLALVPAFLLAYYRGWRGMTVALGVGMLLISLLNVFALLTGRGVPEWPVFFFVVSVYIGIALGAGWLSEVRRRIHELEVAEQQMRKAYAELHASHEELKRTQLQLIQAEKLESIGRLAAGVAHEVKNPLMTILWGVQYLAERLPADDDSTAQLLKDMREAVKRANAVITGLLDFSSPHALDLQIEDLNTVVDGALALVKHQLHRSRISVAKELAADLPHLMLDRFKIEQVLVNIVMNAIHAMPDGGTLTVKTYLRRAGSPDRPSQGHGPDPLGPDNDVVVLEVEDTGTGIPEEKLAKVFDPFFTTKERGKGTGLGLAVVRQIVEMHGGSIQMSNRREGGARVIIAFRLATGGSNDGEEANPSRG